MAEWFGAAVGNLFHMVTALVNEQSDDRIGLESLVVEQPARSNTRDQALLYVSSDADAPKVVQSFLEKGFAVRFLPTLPSAAQYLGQALVDAVIVDADGHIPLSSEVALDTSEYLRSSRELKAFADRSQRTDAELPMLLVSSGKDHALYHRPSVDDLGSIEGVVMSRNGQLHPFDKSELEASKFYPTLSDKIAERARNHQFLVSRVVEALPSKPQDERFPLDVGDAIEHLYDRVSTGGGSFVTIDSVTSGGTFAPLNPHKKYDNARTFHIKRVSPAEAANFARTFEELTKRNKERGERPLKTPAPLGYHVTNEGVYAVRTFVIGTSYADLAAIIRQTEDPLMQGLGKNVLNEALDVFFTEKYPHWYSMTHDLMMEDAQEPARSALLDRQRRQFSYFTEQLGDMLGVGLDAEEASRFERAVAQLYSPGKALGDRFIALPMSSKGQNIGLETFQSLPDIDAIVSRYTSANKVIRSRIQRDFAFWDYNTLERAGTVFSDLYSLAVDPRMGLDEEQRLEYMSCALDRLGMPLEQPEVFAEYLRQGIHHSVLKVIQTAMHAQVHEYHVARGRIRDSETTMNERHRLQDNFEYFIGQVVKHTSLMYRALSENWVEDPASLHSKIIEHNNDFESWFTLESRGAESRAHAYLRSIHKPFADILSSGEHIELQTEHLRNMALQSRFLHY